MFEVVKIHFIKILEQHFQDMVQKLLHGNNKEYFDAHFGQHFILKPIP